MESIYKRTHRIIHLLRAKLRFHTCVLCTTAKTLLHLLDIDFVFGSSKLGPSISPGGAKLEVRIRIGKNILQLEFLELEIFAQLRSEYQSFT